MDIEQIISSKNIGENAKLYDGELRGCKKEKWHLYMPEFLGEMNDEEKRLYSVGVILAERGLGSTSENCIKLLWQSVKKRFPNTGDLGIAEGFNIYSTIIANQ